MLMRKSSALAAAALLIAFPLHAHAQASVVTDVDPAVVRGIVQPGSPARYVLDIRCMDRDTQPACAARATVRVAKWLRTSRVRADDLLVNVDGPRPGIGFQLRGTIPNAAALDGLSIAQVLDRFTWNGGSYEGKDAAARWCMSGGRGAGFCRTFAADACNPVAPPDTLRFCRQR